MIDLLKADYRTCFGTGIGKNVLTDILLEAGFFDADLKTAEEIAVENFVKKILFKAGIYNSDDVSQQNRLVSLMIDMQVEMEKK